MALHTALPGIRLLDEEPNIVDMNTCGTFADMNDGMERALYELVQNWRDARSSREKAAGVDGKWVMGGGTDCISVLDGVLVLTNFGKVLPRTAFAHGGTDKRGNTETAGFFGDGLKLVCAMVARHGWDFGIVSDGVIFSFFLTEPDSRGHQFLMRREKRCDTSQHVAADKAVTVYLRLLPDFDDAEAYLRNCFLELCPPTAPEVEVDGVGSVYRDLPSRFYLHGMRPTDCAGFVPQGGIMEGLCFDYTRPIEQVVKRFHIGRDRFFRNHALDMCKEILAESVVSSEDGGYFWKEYRRRCLDPAILEMEGADLSSFKDETKFIDSLMHCFWSTFPRGRYIKFFKKMIDYICEALGTKHLLTCGSTDEECRAFATMMGRSCVVYFPAMKVVTEKCDTRHHLSDIIEDTMKDLLTPEVPQEASPFMSGVMKQIKNLVPDMSPPVFIKIPDGMRPAIYIWSKKMLLIDQDQIKHYHVSDSDPSSSCIGGQCSCVFLLLLEIMDLDMQRIKGELARRMLSSAGKVVTSKEPKVKPETKRPLEGGASVAAASKVPRLSKSTRTVVDTLRALKDGTAAAGGCCGGGGRYERVEEKEEEEGGGGGKACTTVHELVKDPSIDVFFPRNMERGDDVKVKVILQEFRDMIRELLGVILRRIGVYPDTAIFYDPESTTMAFYVPKERRVFLNLGRFGEERSLGDEEVVWFNVLIHELAHVTVARHDATFANAVQDLTAPFVHW